ncbi:phosphotransferase [Arthrobacter russicus]|uniref:Aminoglycoside phosphotransferase domain-containing protein n=1 Tax=Arthrobacter russicus TaxID=172040 RepID=A0ABU1J847_9MICC|nr:phosphotransferase [Arthrobacter russicus]MDR6268601.1 hypothetical protein [Arthrobacter russicus]
MQFDYAATAMRPAWSDLPEAVRAGIEGNIAAPVNHSAIAAGGFTPGFAAVLNQHWFVKAAPATVPWLFRAYRREAEVAAVLPTGLPMPEFRGAAQLDDGGTTWQLLFFAAESGTVPGNPWTDSALDAIESALLLVDTELTPAPVGLEPEDLARTWREHPRLDEVFPAPMPDFVPDLSVAGRSELQTLLCGAPTALAGESLLHNDLRPDNILLTERGALFCDWNYLARGPRWADWVVMLAYARFDGLDVADRLVGSALSRDADPEHIDSWLALLLAYMLQAGGQAEIADSPALRGHQKFSAGMLLDWLIERRDLS